MKMGIAAIAMLGLATLPAAAQTVKVGLILTYSGPQGSLGDEIDKGLSLYIKTHEKDLPAGVKLELIRRDDTGPNPDVAKRLAQELIARDGVNLLAGLVWTPNANAVAALSAEAKVPVVVMNAAGVTTTRLSPYVARVSFTMWQTSFPLGAWTAHQGLKHAYIAVSDYAPGHDSEEAFTKGFTAGGGEIVGAVRFPVKSPDFVPFVQRIKDAKPDVVFVFVPAGAQAAQFMKAYTELGLKEQGIKLVGTQDLLPEDELAHMGDSALGVVSAGTWSATSARPQNKEFIAAWKESYGTEVVPTYMAVAGWDGMAAIFAVIKGTKGNIDPDKAMAILKGWQNPDSPRGPIMIDPETRDIIENVYIRRVERQGDHLGNVEFETIPQVKDPWKEQNPEKK
ncbi:MAG TPA: ABC transporter substrate-binding protein [Stellaceae bacterium]|nr:ABC transporter substrate-binding protein [Stellaceae bacterium]